MVLTFENKIKPFLSSFTTRNVATAEILGMPVGTVPFATPNMKRARTAASAAAATPKLTLSGGEPHHSELASLWRDARFTDIVAHGHR